MKLLFHMNSAKSIVEVKQASWCATWQRVIEDEHRYHGAQYCRITQDTRLCSYNILLLRINCRVIDRTMENIVLPLQRLTDFPFNQL